MIKLKKKTWKMSVLSVAIEERILTRNRVRRILSPIQEKITTCGTIFST
jgi:hypothetical protein